MEHNQVYRFRVALASSDGQTIDCHFGNTENFYIYEIDQNETWKQIAIRENSNLKNDTSSTANQGKTCGGGGCSGPGGKCHGSLENVSFLSDCSYLLASKVGMKSSKLLYREDIAVLEVTLPIEEAFPKLIAYEKRRSKNWTIKNKKIG
ncbi:NifB/NifX family molybdenum-iron cluster-binding protein [[Clostridium] polysaccharolyticum]|uniref:Dinitrogenase iron-molybdenum cofactor n=1 Tax=[Clostridium] polysaccharolyticum TaxID=29364 RepID=A0A1I0B7Z9_9FIRM|nr:NifB/NifX family molybdenum-iron cluster-binding protein [[Clostridium] polysaccharolyticum]SET02635.1 Dinitrogenase iron-molybdenum cofactor [[Clostridium] polysaccharolyticum]